MSFVLVAFGCGDLLAADLVNAARINNQVELRELLAGGADVDAHAQQGATALHWAAFNGNAELVRMLLKAGARVDAVLDNGSTPLHLAAFEGHTDVVRLLLQHGADPSARTLDGITPAAWARREQHQDTLQALVAGRGSGSTSARAPKTLSASSSAPAPQGMQEQGFRVQLAAVSSEARAREAVAQYQRRFSDILQGLSLVSTPAKLSQAHLYRVQSIALPEARARSICERLKSRGQGCLLRKAGSP